jgi:hypothetical protein
LLESLDQGLGYQILSNMWNYWKSLKVSILKWGCIFITNTYNVQVMAIRKLQIKLSKWFLTIESSCKWVNLIPIEEKNIYLI